MEILNEYKKLFHLQNINTTINLIKIEEFLFWYNNKTVWKSRNLIIKPIYQRKYRWDLTKKSQLVETMILGLPIPAIFLSHDTKNNTYEIIDWLQRIATILEFFWELEEEFIIDNKKSIKLEWLEAWTFLKKLKSFNFKKFDTEEEIINSIKNYEIITIVFNDLNEKLKYSIFRKLNSNSEKLTDQELRNNNIINKSVKFYESLEDLAQQISSFDYFWLKVKDLSEYKDFELILRFYLLKVKESEIKWKSIKDILDREVEKIDENEVIDIKKILKIFEFAARILWRYPFSKGKRKFSPPVYDYVMWFIYNNYDALINLHKVRISDLAVKRAFEDVIYSNEFDKKTWLWKWNSVSKIKYAIEESEKPFEINNK
ncbi:MAG: hypothetical protein ACD_4C00283G0002 [uncultured bacterium (gcode 4)]|uniref:GmrSD restriction endonucleases N-terminal domain-containing protein n=1 Tax=uncultured bacterium (gcode 4) TaxID=1234023 RepID=K2F5V0_9BACT|nr:MAG: hypothetical protein ACD_4C00283G0002 [uncultured bacterium (gcode 4)]